jgi:hypothetical protein
LLELHGAQPMPQPFVELALHPPILGAQTKTAPKGGYRGRGSISPGSNEKCPQKRVNPDSMSPSAGAYAASYLLSSNWKDLKAPMF